MNKTICKICGRDNTYKKYRKCISDHKEFIYVDKDGQLIFKFMYE